MRCGLHLPNHKEVTHKMASETELSSAFKHYFDEVDRCRQGKCYWALLHLLIVLPDICGALESDNGEANRDKYKRWCERYIADFLISSEEWYDIRCVLLHQGRTQGKRGKRYKVYSFSQPNMNGSKVHRKVIDGVLHLDVDEIAKEFLKGMREWTKDLGLEKHQIYATNVEHNLPSLARVTPKGTCLVEGVRIQNLSTSSSPRFL